MAFPTANCEAAGMAEHSKFHRFALSELETLEATKVNHLAMTLLHELNERDEELPPRTSTARKALQSKALVKSRSSKTSWGSTKKSC